MKRKTRTYTDFVCQSFSEGRGDKEKHRVALRKNSNIFKYSSVAFCVPDSYRDSVKLCVTKNGLWVRLYFKDIFLHLIYFSNIEIKNYSYDRSNQADC
jgi:hypothetical protein